MYKKSKYNVTTNNSDYYIISNTLNKTVVILNDKEYKKYNDLNEKSIKKSKFTDMLFESGILVHNNQNESLEALKRHEISKNNMDLLNITIVPTFNCNFDCSYCYQQKIKSNEFITDEVINNIIKFICKRAMDTSTKNIHIAWYGGEPLLCINCIKYINTQVMDFCSNEKIIFTSSIASNIYLLNDDMINDLKSININRIETTLNGTKNFNDKLRYLKGSNKGTFDVVLKNVKKVSSVIPTILNVCVSKDNIDDIDDFIIFLKNNFDKDNQVYLNFNKITKYDSMINDINEIEDFSLIKIDFLKKCLDNGINICDNTNFDKDYIFCPQQHKNSFSIDLYGKVYKCSEYFDDSECLGTIDNEGNLKVLDIDKEIQPEECKQCNLLPYCNFGCASNRKKGLICCPEEREHLGEYLTLFVMKQQLNNR